MLNIKNTLDELKDILNIIKTKQDSHTAWTGTEKADIEKRLNHVLDKSNPRHSNLSSNLDLDLKDLENIDKTIGAEKLRTDTEIKKLSDEKTQLEKDLQAKEALIKQKNEEVGDKLTADFITKLDNLTKLTDKDGKVKIDETTLTAIKTAVEEIKNKGPKVDLTETNKKLEATKSKLDELKSPKDLGANYWSIATLALSAICALLLTFLIFFKSSKSQKELIRESEK